MFVQTQVPHSSTTAQQKREVAVLFVAMLFASLIATEQLATKQRQDVQGKATFVSSWQPIH